MLRTALAALVLLVPLAAPSPAQTSERGVYLPFNDFQLAGAGGITITVNGNAAVNAPDFETFVEFGPTGKPKGVSAVVGFTGAVTLDVTADASGDFSGTLPLAYVPLPPFPVGPMTVVQPFAAVYVAIGGQAVGGMRVAFVQELDAQVEIDIGGTLAGAADTPQLISRVAAPIVSGASTAALSVSTTVAMVFQVVYNGINVGGPVTGATMGFDLGVDPLGDPWWEIDGWVSAFAGYYGAGAFLPVYFPLVSFDIAQADGPLSTGLAPTRWSMVADFGLTEQVAAIVPRGEGLVVAGRTSGSRPWLAELDAVGLVLSERRGEALLGHEQIPAAVVAHADGGLVLAGNAIATGQARVDRFDAAGTSVWHLGYAKSGAAIFKLADMVATSDGGLALLGTATTIVPAGSRPVLTRLDASGAVLWAVELSFGTAASTAHAARLIEAANGDFLLSATITYTDVGAGLGNTNLLLARFDAVGGLLWAKVTGAIPLQTAGPLVEALDGSIVTGGLDNEAPDFRGWLATFESDGSLRWSASYLGADAAIDNDVITGLSPVEGGTLVAGHHGSGASRDAWLALIDDGGSVVWWKSLIGAAEETSAGVLALDDGLVAWGFTASANPGTPLPDQDLWIVRADVDGMLHFDAGSGFDAHNENVTWHATGGTVSIDMPQATSSPVTVTATARVLLLAPSAAAITTTGG